MTKRVAIAELEGAALNRAVRAVKHRTFLCPEWVAESLSEWAKREWLSNHNPSGFVEVPDELVEGQ